MKSYLLIVVLFISFSGIKNGMAQKDEAPARNSRIKVITIDNGITTVTDTLIEEGRPGIVFTKGNKNYVFSLNGEPGLNWEERFVVDSTGKTIVITDKKVRRPEMLNIDEWQKDSLVRERIQIEKGPGGERQLFFIDENFKGRKFPVPPAEPGIGFVPDPSGRIHLRQKPNAIIDLTDQRIISYKKKKLSGGREKITVIRKEEP